jgi:hypothetical protein
MKAGETVNPGLTAEVRWSIEGNSLLRAETISASAPIKVRRIWVIIPTSGDHDSTRFDAGIRTDQFDSSEGSLEATVTAADWPFHAAIFTPGNSALGKGNRGPIPLYLELDANDVTLQPGKPMKWTLRLTVLPLNMPESTIPKIKPNPDVLH